MTQAGPRGALLVLVSHTRHTNTLFSWSIALLFTGCVFEDPRPTAAYTGRAVATQANAAVATIFPNKHQKNEAQTGLILIKAFLKCH